MSDPIPDGVFAEFVAHMQKAEAVAEQFKDDVELALFEAADEFINTSQHVQWHTACRDYDEALRRAVDQYKNRYLKVELFIKAKGETK